MNEIQRHGEIMEAIGTLNGNVSGINTRLDQINGTIAKHSEGLIAVGKEVAEHPFVCELRPKMEQISRQLGLDESAAVARDNNQTTAAVARDAANARWRRVVMPIVYITTGAIVNALAPKLAEWVRVIMK